MYKPTGVGTIVNKLIRLLLRMYPALKAKADNVMLNPAEHDAFLWIDANSVNELVMSKKMLVCVQDALEISSSIQ